MRLFLQLSKQVKTNEVQANMKMKIIKYLTEYLISQKYKLHVLTTTLKFIFFKCQQYQFTGNDIVCILKHV
jgi:hypothetical protein